MANWFALRVRPKHEKTVAMKLSMLGFDEYLPMHQVRRLWSDRVKVLDTPLFPGYLFCRFAYSDRLRVLNSPGVESIVGFGKTDVPVEDSEIAAVRMLVASGKPLAHLPFLRIGQNVVIERGPLAGIRGVVLRDESAWRVVVSVEALDRSIAVEVDREVLQTWPSTSLEIAL
ncbi:MAG TPA: UpxY family transcription antiterminator [Bryobacteraceae bacterium]|jgi:transcription antitermination factor NusG|nr:UpxY family transcription antiterminator [Bryobacteraceae bacterium]